MKIQIVVGSELEGDVFIPLRVQKENASEYDIRMFIKMRNELREQAEKDMAHTIMQISISNNQKTYLKIKEDAYMNSALEKLMEDRINPRVGQNHAEELAEEHREERADLLSRLQSYGMLTPEQIATIQNWQF